jgi:hypothetical protein
MNRVLVALALVFLLLSPTSAAARDPKKQQYRWAELDGRIRGRTIAFILTDGTHVKGKVLGVEAERLRLKVNETSNPIALPKGERLIPAQSLCVLRVMETGKKWRIICTIALPFVVLAAIAGAAGDLLNLGSLAGVPSRPASADL